MVIASRSLVRVLKLAYRLLDEVPDAGMDEKWLDNRQEALDDIEEVLKALNSPHREARNDR